MITTLINADEVEMERDLERSVKSMAFMMKHPRLAALDDKLWEIRCRLIATLVCSHFGHKIEDQGSYAGPDSGRDCYGCTRCQQSWEHIYY